MQQYAKANGQAIVSRPASLHSDRSNSINTANNEEERPRKRVRKGTRSCWECKRRKIRCQLSSEDVPVCSGCLSRGTNCLSQEYPEEKDYPSSGTQVGERLGRVERLLETLVAKITSYEEEEKGSKMLTPDSTGANDILSGYSTPGDLFSMVESSSDRHDSISQLHQSTRTPGTRTPSRALPKIERIRLTLVELLPSQEDTDMICEASNSWLLIHSMSSHAANIFIKNHETTTPFNMAELSKKHPTRIAQTLVYLAICLQQIQNEFDASRLHLYPSVESRMDKYLTTVNALITSDDELVSTLEGLECLALMGIYYINAGSPKRAWLTFRRAMNVGQLLGINKKAASSTMPGSRDVWHQLVQGDRYLALLLGLPAGSGDDLFDPEETFHNPAIDKDVLFVRKMAIISTRIIERNQSETPHAYAATQEIDEKLDTLAKAMPASWWEIPSHVLNQKTPEVGKVFDRLMTQIYFFQLQALLHLPFMLQAATERRYDFSKFSCLKASREMMWRYLAMRTTEDKTFCCRAIDFGALTATVSLFLGTLDHGQVGESRELTQQRDDDRALIHSILQCTEELSKNGKDVVATQSAGVIKSLLAVDPPSGENGGNLRLTIPYYGTVSIVRPTQRPVQNGTSIIPVLPGQQSITFGAGAEHATEEQPWPSMEYSNQNPMNCPTVSFTSSHFPPLFPERPIDENLTWDQSDTLYFDSSLDADIEGNWLF